MEKLCGEEPDSAGRNKNCIQHTRKLRIIVETARAVVVSDAALHGDSGIELIELKKSFNVVADETNRDYHHAPYPGVAQALQRHLR